MSFAFALAFRCVRSSFVASMFILQVSLLQILMFLDGPSIKFGFCMPSQCVLISSLSCPSFNNVGVAILARDELLPVVSRGAASAFAS